MTADQAVRYETKTMQALRGNVGRTITKWEQQGWEVVSRDDGALRSEVVLRKTKRTVDVHRYAMIGGAMAVVVGVGVAGSIVVGGGGNESTAAAPTVPSSAQSTPSPSPTTEVPSPSAVTEDVITTENNPQFAAILTLGDYCASDIASFAQQYRGRTVSFPASITHIAPFEGTTTRYSILLGPGDAGAGTTRGPAFQFRDVNTTSDLNYTGDVPGSLVEGALLDVTAEVDSYVPQQCLFLLDPVETSFR